MLFAHMDGQPTKRRDHHGFDVGDENAPDAAPRRDRRNDGTSPSIQIYKRFLPLTLLTATQIPIFERDPDGTSPKSRYIMGRRNWCSVKWDPQNGDLVWDIRVEIQKGNGQTSGCVSFACASFPTAHVRLLGTSSAPRRLAGIEYIHRYRSPTTESCLHTLLEASHTLSLCLTPLVYLSFATLPRALALITTSSDTPLYLLLIPCNTQSTVHAAFATHTTHAPVRAQTSRP